MHIHTVLSWQSNVHVIRVCKMWCVWRRWWWGCQVVGGGQHRIPSNWVVVIHQIVTETEGWAISHTVWQLKIYQSYVLCYFIFKTLIDNGDGIYLNRFDLTQFPEFRIHISKTNNHLGWVASDRPTTLTV